MKYRPIEDRFWEKAIPEPNSGCWLWDGAANKNGYGNLGVGKTTVLAHRISVLLDGRNIPDGMIVRHTCDFPPCVNPRHLLVGTRTDNARDSIARNRFVYPLRRHKGDRPREILCKKGLHSMEGDNAYLRVSTGHFECKECKRATRSRRDAIARELTPT